MFRYSLFALPAVLFAGAPHTAEAACLKDGNTVICTEQDTNGYVSPTSSGLSLTVNPGATLYNLNNGEFDGDCDELALPGVWLGEDNRVVNGGTIVTQGVCGGDIALGNRGTVINRGQLVAYDTLGFGILAGDGSTITNSGGISTRGQAGYGLYIGNRAAITTEAGGFILTEGGGANAVMLLDSGVIDNRGRIETVGTASDGIIAGAGATVRNTGTIITRAAQSSALRATGGAITITNSGQIGALFAGRSNAPSQSIGILANGDSIAATNAGIITGAFAAAQLTAAGSVSVVNSGTMTATGQQRNDGAMVAGGAVILANARAGDSITIANTGDITATNGQAAIRATGGNTGVSNSGTITGDILLGGGDDMLALSTGARVSGTFDGGGGLDTLLLTGSGDFSGPIANVEQLSKSGGGAWTLHKALTFSRQANVLDGVLRIDRDGALTTPAFNIIASGTLAGAGAIAGTVSNAGTLAPGVGASGPTMLTILGAYIQDAAGTLALNVSGAGADSLYVGGTAALNGTLRITYDPATAASHFTGARERRIVFAADRGLTVQGDFARILSNAPFLETRVRSSAMGVDLVYSRISYGAAAANPNQRAAGAMLDRMVGTPALAGVVAALDSGTPATAPAILAALAPETVPALQNLGLFTLQLLRDARLIPGAEKYLAWGTFLNRHGSADRPGAAAFHYDINGGSAGFSLKAGEGLRLQALLAHTSADASFTSPASGTLGGNFAGLGVSYEGEILTASGGVIYGTAHPETRRTQVMLGTTSNLSARGSADMWSVYGALSAPFELGAIALTPSFTLARESVSLSGFAETGALTATVLPSRTMSLRAETGLRAEAGLDGVRPYLGLRLAKELLSGQRKATVRITGVPGSDFSVSGQRTRGVALSLDGGIKAGLAPGVEAHAGVHFTANDVFAGRALSAGVTYRW